MSRCLLASTSVKLVYKTRFVKQTSLPKERIWPSAHCERNTTQSSEMCDSTKQKDLLKVASQKSAEIESRWCDVN
jgi:hypothetical protein